MIIRYSTIALVATPLFLVGCGGGGGSTLPYSASLLKVFPDDAGVIKLSDVNTSERIYVLTPEAAAITTEINNGSLESNPDSIFSGLTVTDTSLPHADVATGTLTIGGVAANITAFGDRTSDAVGVLMTVPNIGTIALVGPGSALNGLPSGTHTYVGTEMVARRTNVSPVVGTFSMSADFTNNVVSYNGTTANSTMVISNMSLNSATGDFAGSNGTLTFNGTPYSTTLYGSFGGTGASGVGGVYVTNDTNATYEGGFIGHKQ